MFDTSKVITQKRISINSILSIIQEIHKKLEQVIKDIEKYKWKNTDSRSLLLAGIWQNNILTMYSFSLFAESKNASYPKEWYNKNISLNSDKDNFKNRIDYIDYIYFNKIQDDYLLEFFYLFEPIIRTFVKKILIIPNLNPKNKKQIPTLTGIEKFYWIRKGFFEEYLKFSPKETEVLVLIQNIRNSIHNAGFFSEVSKTVSFNGNSYTFTKDAPINFITWDLIKDIAISLIALIEKTLNDKKINSISEIEDPISEIKRIKT